MKLSSAQDPVAGAGRSDQTHAYLSAGLLAGAAQAVLITALGEALLGPLSQICATPEAAASAHTYLAIRLLGNLSVLCGGALQETRVALGDSRGPMRAALLANAFHVALAYLLILVLDGGVAGAAWATVISQYLETGLLLLAQRPDGFRPGSVRMHHLQQLWTLGWPTALQFMLEVGSFAVLSAMVASWRELDMAAHQIAMQLQNFAFLPSLAFGEAASVLVGRAVGAGHKALVARIARSALLVVSIYSALCTLVFALCATPIAALFTRDPALTHLTRQLLHVACLFMFADASNIVARCTLRGTGDVRTPAVVGIVSAWLLTPPLTFALGQLLGWGVVGAWLGLTCEIILGAVILWRRILLQHWHPAAERSYARSFG